MDIVILLLFMAIFYLGPALLKSYSEKIKTQPTAPEPIHYEIKNPPLQTNKEMYMSSNNELQSTMAVDIVDKIQNIPTIAEEKSAWKGKMDQNAIINGVIFAEIILPPRAYRPFIKR